jgi:NADH-quinone oxidoreductase subunit M
MGVGIPILSIVTYIPLAGALAIVFFLPKERTGAIKGIATLVAVVDFVVSLPLWFLFERGKDGYQFVEKASWIPSLGVDYHFGIDGISLLLILLTTLMGVIAVVCSYTAISERQKEYYVLLLLLQTFMIGTFCALDLFLFYVFWEVMLVPMYFLIGVWGSDRRLYAAIKFFLYTLAGSVLMLLGIIALYFYNTTGFLGYKGLGNSPTFSIEKLTAVAPIHTPGQSAGPPSTTAASASPEGGHTAVA